MSTPGGSAGRQLSLPGGHQETVGAQEIVLVADDDVGIVFSADVFAPPDWLLGRDPTIGLHHGPGARERVVDRGDVVVEEVRVILVEMKPFLDDGQAILVERDAACIVSARTFEAARLDGERVVVGLDLARSVFQVQGVEAVPAWRAYADGGEEVKALAARLPP
jgi:hypothetical protein